MAFEEKRDVFQHILQDLHDRIEGLEELVIFQQDGTLLAELYTTEKANDITTIAKEFAEVSQGVCQTLERGVGAEAIIKGQKRFIAIYNTPTADIILTMVGKSTTNFGLVNSGGRIAIKKIQETVST